MPPMKRHLLSSFFGAALLAACGGTVAPAADAGSSNDSSVADGGNDGAVGKGCGGAGDCKPSEWCDVGGFCPNVLTKKGTCKARPMGCPDLYAPTCGCDGTVYSSPCDAQAAGIDTNKQGGCVAPAGWISCGAGFCQSDFSFCVATPNDAVSPQDPIKVYYTCANLPPACQKATSCACFPKNVPCPQTSCVYDNGFTVGCPGG